MGLCEPAVPRAGLPKRKSCLGSKRSEGRRATAPNVALSTLTLVAGDCSFHFVSVGITCKRACVDPSLLSRSSRSLRS